MNRRDLLSASVLAGTSSAILSAAPLAAAPSDSAKAKALGLQFRSLADITQATLAWHKEFGLNRKMKAGLTPEREAELLKKLG